MSKEVYIIAHTYEDIDLTISVFYSNHKAVKYASEWFEGDGFRKPHDIDEPIEEYFSDYWEFIQEEQDNQSNLSITFEIIKL